MCFSEDGLMSVQRIIVEPTYLQYFPSVYAKNERFASRLYNPLSFARSAGASPGEHLRFSLWEQIMRESIDVANNPVLTVL